MTDNDMKKKFSITQNQLNDMAHAIELMLEEKEKYAFFERKERFKQKWLTFLDRTPLMPWHEWEQLKIRIARTAKAEEFNFSRPLTLGDVKIIRMLMEPIQVQFDDLVKGSWKDVPTYQRSSMTSLRACIRCDAGLANISCTLNQMIQFLENKELPGEPS